MSITCLAVAGRMHGVLGFSWAREKTLLPMAPGKEVWEDLYPAGSVLKLYNVQVNDSEDYTDSNLVVPVINVKPVLGSFFYLGDSRSPLSYQKRLNKSKCR